MYELKSIDRQQSNEQNVGLWTEIKCSYESNCYSHDSSCYHGGLWIILIIFSLICDWSVDFVYRSFGTSQFDRVYSVQGLQLSVTMGLTLVQGKGYNRPTPCGLLACSPFPSAKPAAAAAACTGTSRHDSTTTCWQHVTITISSTPQHQEPWCRTHHGTGLWLKHDSRGLGHKSLIGKLCATAVLGTGKACVVSLIIWIIVYTDKTSSRGNQDLRPL